MPMLVDLDDACRRSGLPVLEESGWRTRGHGQMAAVRCVVLHHTAGPSSGDAPSLRVVRDGRPDLRGPLSHLVLARSGAVHVVAAGLCWHTGATHESWQGNATAIGIEAEHTGTGPWPAVQYDAYVRLARALADHYRVPYARVLGHREIAKPTGRKPDPTFDLAAFRTALGQSSGGGPGGPDSLPTLKVGDQNAAVASLQTWLNRHDWTPDLPLLKVDSDYGPATVRVVRAAQGQCGITGPDANGENVGPRTKSAFYARGWRG